jgi:broad specificity phosphatase PhoE
MSDDAKPRLWLVRHGETEWSRSGRHTGRTDIPLTDRGREQARMVGERLAGHTFAAVRSSPMSRALDTARLAGFGDRVEVDPDLCEWDYGVYEGRTTPEIREETPGWSVWTHPIPKGESAVDIGRRVDGLIDRLDDVAGDVLVFAHGHVLRVIAARWLELPPTEGRRFVLHTATVSVLGWERETRAIERWNEGADDG